MFRRNRIAVEDAYYERQIATLREEFAALEAEREKASAERKARLEARIEDTRHKLQDKRDEFKARIESIKREDEAKIESLQQQLRTARDERKQRLEKRLAVRRCSACSSTICSTRRKLPRRNSVARRGAIGSPSVRQIC